MKKILSILCALLLLAGMLPCAFAQGEVRIGALTGPTAMGMVKMMEENGENFTLLGSADELMPLILQEEVDIAAVPANLAATLYQKTDGAVTVLAVNVLGVLYIGELNGDGIQSVTDLKGKTVYATGKGATPEYFLRHILEGNGLDPQKDVTIEWRSEPAEVVALLNARGNGIAMLPQPYATAAQMQLEGDYRTALSVSEEWEKLEEDALCTTAVILARTDYAREHPEQIQQFLERFAESVAWVNEHSEQAAPLCESYGIMKATVAEKAIPHCNLVCITGDEMKRALQGCLEVIFDQNPKAVGGAMPGDEFYYGAQ